MLDHAFGFVDRVWFHIGIHNLRSRRAIVKVGGRLSHEVLDDPDRNGVSMAYYYIDRPAAQR